MTNDTTTQPIQPQEQPDEIEAFLNIKMPEPHFTAAVQNGVPLEHATNRLKLVRLILDRGLQPAFDYAINAIRTHNPRGDLHFQSAMARAAVGKVSYDVFYEMAKEIRRQAQQQEPLPPWQKAPTAGP